MTKEWRIAITRHAMNISVKLMLTVMLAGPMLAMLTGRADMLMLTFMAPFVVLAAWILALVCIGAVLKVARWKPKPPAGPPPPYHVNCRCKTPEGEE